MNIHVRNPGTRQSERGGALVAVFVIVIICGALAVSVLLPAIARHKAAKAAVQSERAFQLAEAGIDFGIAEIRKSLGAVPTNPTATGAPGNGTSGSYALTYTAGNANGQDDDGDGFADDSDEADFVQLVSTGTYGESQRTVRVMLRRSVQSPTIVASIQFNVANPILDLKGNRFFVSGFDHDTSGTQDPTLSPMHGMASPSDPADLAAQINGQLIDQVQGADGAPSVRYVDPIDLDQMVEQARAAKTHTVTAGTHTNFAMGSLDAAGIAVAMCDGDLHLSGAATGYGILVVDGDLTCSGQFEWTGIVIVRGRTSMVGGGTSKRLIGAMIVGEEVADTKGYLKLTGTVDMLYSSRAVELAQNRLAMMTVLSWQEIGSP